uniref:Uncharacterized protein n=1 Tax=Siphoviridae sp. ctYyB9 TaxID=2826380 RepID=A0A8S5MXM8_9CAUD|nr:MAG TPA: hypothetical protein [Siphoviridae sp. ctYyB9]
MSLNLKTTFKLRFHKALKIIHLNHTICIMGYYLQVIELNIAIIYNCI